MVSQLKLVIASITEAYQNDKVAPKVAIIGVVLSNLCSYLLQIPLSTCWTWLEEEEGLSFCGGCNTLVEQGISLVRLLDSLETQLTGVQFKLSALLLNQHHLNENEGNEDKSLRFSLIGEIKGRLKFNEALVKGNFGQTETDQGQVIEVLEEDDELSDGKQAQHK